MLDYDGTLAPFHNDRFEARPYPGVGDRLAILSAAPQVRLVLVSGRSAYELHDLLPSGTKAEIWGSHGREQLKSDGSYELFTLNSGQQAALDQVGRDMSALGFSKTLEVKPTSLAVHWRGFEPATQERSARPYKLSSPAWQKRTVYTCYLSMAVRSCALSTAPREALWRRSSRKNRLPSRWLIWAMI